jgi:tetratricopeptide (TPR) repeat protein
LLAAQTGKYDTAQRLAEQALSLAERASVERYIWAIRLDIANLKLQSGAIEEALDLFLDVTDQTVQRYYHHFTAAQALLGLMTALLQQGKLKQATQVCQDGLPRWRSSGLLLKYGDVIAHWLVLAQHPKMAVTWLGAANAFNRANEVKRNMLATQTHDRVLALLRQYIPDSQLQTWLAQSDVNANEAHADETLLTQELETLLKAHLAAQ